MRILSLRVQGEHTTSSGLVDGIRDVSGSSGMVFTALGMLTKQTSVQHPFGNAADEFGNAIDGSGRPGMGSGLVRECLGGVWTASRHEQV